MSMEARLKKNQITSIITSTLDNLSLMTYFGLYATPVLFEFLISVGKHFLLPINMAASLIYATLAWRQAHIERNKRNKTKSYLIFRAVIETISAIGISAAVIGSMFFSSAIGMMSSLIFAINAAVKTLINTGTAIYHCVKAAAKSNAAAKQKHKDKAKNFAIQAVAGLVGTIAITIIMVFGKTALFGLGIASGVLNLIILATKVPALMRKAKKGPPLLETEGCELRTMPTSTLRTSSTSGIRNALNKEAVPNKRTCETTKNRTDLIKTPALFTRRTTGFHPLSHVIPISVRPISIHV